jgi:regulatory protein YycH of two-component signal transduction system YycFG
MSKPNMIEKAKNLSLVVLFLSTILLLYFFWGNISFGSLSIKTLSDQPAENVPSVAGLIEPEQIFVSFGSENYTILPPDKLWYNGSGNDCFIKELRKFGPVENTLVREIPKETYQQVRKIRSIWADFGYDMPFSDFCKVFDVDSPNSYNVIETVTAIGYSTAEKGNSIFIYDGKNSKYYWLQAAGSDGSGSAYGGTDFPGFIDSIEGKGYNSYYPAGSVLGVTNSALIPLDVSSSLGSFSYSQELYSYQTEKINTIAGQFFGSNFDFVRKITEESGTIIYMYGYGQNVLIVNTDGSIEYKEESTGENIGSGFSESLETAVNFVEGHGSWEPMSGAKKEPYLKSVVKDPGKKNGYRFQFGMKIDGTPLLFEDGEAIIVDVIDGQATYYKRHLIEFDQNDLDTASSDASDPAFSPVNLIAQNVKYIYDALLEEGAVEATADPAVMFEAVASKVSKMQIGYVKQQNPEINEIKPVWTVSVNDVDVYFDLYSAEPIGYSKK